MLADTLEKLCEKLLTKAFHISCNQKAAKLTAD